MDMLTALRLQIEWGADEALEDAPVDRLATPMPTPALVARPVHIAAVAKPSIAARAQIAAQAANTIEALRQALAAFTDCPLAATATKLVFADGNPQSGLVVVGEAPGNEEDAAGRPFVGEAGKFLDRMFASIGLSRADMLITNLIPWRPPGNRPPTPTEVQTCLPFLQRHLTLLRPRYVVTLGTLPVRALTGRAETLRKLRGRWLDLQVSGLPNPVKLLPMLHPAQVPHTSVCKREAWADLITLRKALSAL